MITENSTETSGFETLSKTAAIDAILERLIADFPKCFTLENPRPLKIGIRGELRARYPDISYRNMSAALFHYAKRKAYLRALAEGRERIDLDGNDAGTPTTEERAAALDKLKKKGSPQKKGKAKPSATAKIEPKASPAPESPPPAATMPARPILRLKPKAKTNNKAGENAQ